MKEFWNDWWLGILAGAAVFAMMTVLYATAGPSAAEVRHEELMDALYRIEVLLDTNAEAAR